MERRDAERGYGGGRRRARAVVRLLQSGRAMASSGATKESPAGRRALRSSGGSSEAGASGRARRQRRALSHPRHPPRPPRSLLASRSHQAAHRSQQRQRRAVMTSAANTRWPRREWARRGCARRRGCRRGRGSRGNRRVLYDGDRVFARIAHIDTVGMDIDRYVGGLRPTEPLRPPRSCPHRLMSSLHALKA